MENALKDVKRRNYQIDVLRMIFTVMIFMCHTFYFQPLNNASDANNTVTAFHAVLGWTAVMGFFMISGFLMVKSICRRNYEIEKAGKSAIGFVTDKFKSLALPFWIAGAMYLCCFLIIYIYLWTHDLSNEVLGSLASEISTPLDIVVNAINEMFCLTNTGGMFYAGNNSQTWYISAMLLAMIPIVYLLIKKKDFFIYVLSPLVAIISLGFLKNTFDPIVTDDGNSRLIRACCGLCFGVLAWTMCEKISMLSNKKSNRIALTIIELFLYIFFFAVIFNCAYNPDLMFSILLLLPIAIAITFSGKSYLAELFKGKVFRCFGSISLYVYLNHNLAINISRALFLEKGYWFCTLCAAALTAIICVVCYIGVRIVKLIITRIKKSNQG